MRDGEIQRSLESDSQIIEQRMPKGVTTEEAAEVAASLSGFMKRQGMSRRKVAQALGCSSTTIGRFLAGKYKGDLHELTNKVVNFMNAVARREGKRRPFVRTAVARKIGALITQTDAFSVEEGKIAIIIGDSGHGKSHCLKQYCQANKNAVYIQLDQVMGSHRLFGEIARTLGIDCLGWLSHVVQRLIRILQTRHTVIILDEASGLTVKQLDQLRQIIAVKCHCPLILAGNDDLLRTVMQPSSKKGQASLDQFRSRLMAVLNLDKIAADGGDDGLYSPKEIRELYEHGGIRLLNSAVSMLKRICLTPGSGRLRTCTHIITALYASRVVVDKGCIDGELIRAAIEQLDLPVRDLLPMAGIDSVEDEQSDMAIMRAG